MHTSLITLTAAAALILAAPKEDKEVDTIRVLLVTGVDYGGHRWKETAPAVRAVLEKDKRLEVRIVEDPGFLASNVIFNYDVVFMHFKDYRPGDAGIESAGLRNARFRIAQEEQVRENLVKFVKRGKGLVLFHFACGAFSDWPEFRNLAGKVYDPKQGHDPRGPFLLKIVDTEHPITRTMKDFRTDDELYFCIAGKRPVEVLATARSKVTGKDHPMVFVFDYGKGRVFHTPLGHDVKAIQVPGVAELVRRGCVWAAGRQP